MEPAFISSFSQYPKPNCFRLIRALHSLLTLSNSRYRSYICKSIYYWQICGAWPTGTVFGNSSFVSLLRWLINWLGVVLHSRLSRWNSSSTRNVNAVLGFRKVAGKSPAAISCISRLGVLGQQHHLAPISWTPDLSMIVINGLLSLSFWPGFELPKPNWNFWSAARFSSARISLLLSLHSSS